VIPADAKLTPRPKEIPAWADMSAEQKRLFERQMETFAGFGEHTDHEVGRLVAQLEAIGELDNTLFFYIVGDNGSSAEGGPEGTYNEMMALNGIIGKADQMMDHVDAWGDATTFPHFAIGWAWAGNTPFQWTKQVASHFGGTRNGMVLHWPERIAAKGEIRSQFHHVVDVAPTVLEAAQLPQPSQVHGVPQRPMDGVSMLYSVADAQAAERRTTQYFEMFGNRGIYHEGWVACTRHSVPWEMAAKMRNLKDDVWELYDVRADFSQANDLAQEQPAKLAELQAVFLQEAERNHVLPLDDRRAERFNPSIAGRPDLMGPRKSLTVYPGMTGMLENTFLNVKGVRHTVTAEVELKDATTEGVIIAQAGYFGGWALYMKAGKVHHEYNWFALQRTNVASPAALAPGKHTIVYEFIPDATKPGTGGKSILSVDGKQVAEGHIPKTQPFLFSADEGTDVGLDGETNVSADYPQGNNAFTGKIVRVTVAQK
jgi:arylsulfatase